VATGKPVWVYETGAETWGTPLVADGKLFLGTKKNLVVMATGREPRELAKIALGAPCYATPIAANGVLYVASERFLWAVRKGAQPAAQAGEKPPPR
jgi:outer membrane protein assembly factor BamB